MSLHPTQKKESEGKKREKEKGKGMGKERGKKGTGESGRVRGKRRVEEWRKRKEGWRLEGRKEVKEL